MGTDDKWIVKSADSIHGPYPFDHVVESIFKGDIHLLDEIKGPYERWSAIKDNPLFAAAIEKLKATTYSGSENTVTQTVDLQTKTQELTKTHTLTHNQTQEISQTPSLNEDSRQPVGSPQSPPSPPEQPQHHYPIPTPHSGGSRTFGVFVMSFMMLAFAAGTFFVYESRKKIPNLEREQSAEKLADRARELAATADYGEALNHYILAYNHASEDPHIILEMAPLSVQFDGQFSHVEILIENLLARDYRKDVRKRGKNIIGLTHSYRGRYQDAVKAYKEAIEVDDNYFPAEYNLAYAYLKLGKPKLAVKRLKKGLDRFGDKPVAQYLYVRSLLELGIAEDSQDHLDEALSSAQQFEQKFSNLKQEMLFLKSLIKKTQGVDVKDLEVSVRNFLRVDADLTSLHVHSPHLDFQSLSWLEFSSQCHDLAQSLKGMLGKLNEGFCLLKSNQVLDAKKIFENLLVEHNKDGSLQSLHASTLLRLGEASQAKNVLGFIQQIDDKTPVVETVLRGCLQDKNLSCAQAIFKGPHGRHISLLYSHWGHAELMSQKNKSESMRSVELGLEVSPDFAPLRRLKRTLK